jgi:hypothetical protein
MAKKKLQEDDAQAIADAVIEAINDAIEVEVADVKPSEEVISENKVVSSSKLSGHSSRDFYSN